MRSAVRHGDCKNGRKQAAGFLHSISRQIFENKFTQGKIKLVQGIDIFKRSIVLVNTGHGVDERCFVSSDQGKISDIF